MECRIATLYEAIVFNFRGVQTKKLDVIMEYLIVRRSRHSGVVGLLTRLFFKIVLSTMFGTKF